MRRHALNLTAHAPTVHRSDAANLRGCKLHTQSAALVDIPKVERSHKDEAEKVVCRKPFRVHSIEESSLDLLQSTEHGRKK